MPFLEYKNVRIAGMSAAVPKHIEKTISTTSKYETEDFIVSVGVREKRYSNDFTASDLCRAAAERLLTDLSWSRDEIDALIFVSQTPDYILPATACVLHGKMGLKKNCIAMDISMGCSGWVYGLSTLMSLINNGGGEC